MKVALCSICLAATALLSDPHLALGDATDNAPRYHLPDPSTFLQPFREAFADLYQYMGFTDDQLFQLALESETDVRYIEGIGHLYIIKLHYRDSGGEYLRGASGLGPFMVFRRTEGGLEHLLNFDGSDYQFPRTASGPPTLNVSASFSMSDSSQVRYHWTGTKFELEHDTGQHYSDGYGLFHIVRHGSLRRERSNAPHTVYWEPDQKRIEVLQFYASQYHFTWGSNPPAIETIRLDNGEEEVITYRWTGGRFEQTLESEGRSGLE